jgi:hypothetical protein
MRRIAMLLVATGIAGGVAAHERPPQPRPRGCSAIEITAPGVKKQPHQLLFSTRRILDLDFETRLEEPVYGDHVLHFRVLTPSGFLYQDMTVPFSWPRPGRKGADGDGGEIRTVASVASGLPVQQLGDLPGRDGRRRTTLRARLPVAGTSITMSTLYGRWSVQAFLDDRTRPCSPPQHFTIHSK